MILAFCGQAGAGKDTATNAVKDSKSAIIALADPIKRFVQDVWGFPSEVLWGESKLRDTYSPNTQEAVRAAFYENYRSFLELTDPKTTSHATAEYFLFEWFNGVRTYPQTARHLLQTLGTEYGRNLNPNVWIDICLKDAFSSLESQTDLVIVPDARFRNEVLAIKRAGGKVIKLYTKETSNATHVSETQLATIPDYWFDGVIFNSKTNLEYFKFTVQNVVNTITRPTFKLA